MAYAPNGFLWTPYAHDSPPLVHTSDLGDGQALDFGVINRKRPKYTRSKTGCLTCRHKKVKCDESKPKCQRCSNAQRECAWPEPRNPHRHLSSSSSPTGDSSEDGPCTSDTSSTRNSPLDHSPCTSGTSHAAYTNPNEIFSIHSIHQELSPAPRLPHSPLYSLSYGYTPHVSGSNHHPNDFVEGQHTFDSARTGIYPASPLFTGTRNGSHVQHQATPAMLYSPDALAPYYNSDQERQLMHHYTTNAANIILSIPVIDPISSTQVVLAMSQPPGTSVLVDALRTAIFGIAATHQSFLRAYSGPGADGTTPLHQPNVTTQQQLAQSYRRDAKKLLAGACTDEAAVRSDMALVTVQAIALIDIFGGGSGEHWSRNIALGKALIRFRGGPRMVLQQAQPANRAQTNLFLELIAAYDVFGSWATGEKPELLAPGARDWWDERVTSHFENIFGFSKSMMVLIADVVHLLARVASSSPRIEEVVEGQDPINMHTTEGQALLDRLNQWSALAGSTTHERVQVGNDIYRRTLQVLLLLEVFAYPISDPLVQQYVRIIIGLTTNAVVAGMGVILIWPVVIAGSTLSAPERHLVTAILAKFRTQCCFEVDIAQNIIFKVWERLDRGEPRADWRSVVQDHNWNFLVL